MVLIALLAYVLSQQADGIAKALPILAALAVGLQRLLPALQQAYQAWSTIHGAQASLQDALELLDQPLPDYAEEPPATPLPFQHQISLKQLSFRYGPQTPWVLKNIDLVITKGSCVGIIGTTGSGKSTLLDIIMGLLPPTEGSINIDGQPISMRNLRAWRTHIAHVPQTVFLADGSINENIAFGVPKDQIEFQRVRQAARQAQIADIIEAWPLQYQTVVGERGVQLSGGQRQRIGIARALYKRANVIIFDEATSALDNETEEAVLQAIELLSKDLTILIIAHRLTTVRKCTQIIKLDRGVFMENDSRAI
jgi:ATP-binding cassette subfamily B protein